MRRKHRAHFSQTMGTDRGLTAAGQLSRGLLIREELFQRGRGVSDVSKDPSGGGTGDASPGMPLIRWALRTQWCHQGRQGQNRQGGEEAGRRGAQCGLVPVSPAQDRGQGYSAVASLRPMC